MNLAIIETLGEPFNQINVFVYMNLEWMEVGECNDKPPSLFFPSDGSGVEKAKKVCVECIVKDDCLEYALENRVDHGVWGGTSERQRRRILKTRKQAAKEGIPNAEYLLIENIDKLPQKV